MFKRLVVVVGILLFAAVPCFGAGSVTLNDRIVCPDKDTHGDVNDWAKCYRVLTWTYDSDSEAAAITGTATSDATNCIGKIVQFISVPSTTTAPDDLFDVEIRDQSKNGYDILNGAGDDLPNDCSTGDHEDECRKTPVDAHGGGYVRLVGETLRFWIDNMDDSENGAAGDIILVIELP
jgi:hypothetical protein